MLAACTATFTACNSDESSLPAVGNQLQLSFGINAPQSRAIFTDTKLPDGKPVGVRLSGYADYANLVYTGTTSGSKQTWTSTTSVTLTDTKGTLYAYWPQSNAVSIDAIDVDMTAADQTDWLYATPVTDVSEDKASVAVTMNHALANINVKVNKGSYLGAGNITNITVQSDGIALGGTFNAAQTTPGYTAFEEEGKPLSRTVTTTAGAAATDIMVVPTGTSAAVTFLLTIDGIQFTATSAAVQLAMGNSYQYTLNLSDISTYMEISGFSVKQWTTVTGGSLALDKVGGGEPLTWDNAPNGVYAVSATGNIVLAEDANTSCIAVALIVNDAPVPQKLWIEKTENYHAVENSYSLVKNNNTDLSLTNYTTIDGTNESGNLGSGILDNYTNWTIGALSDFNGKANTNVYMNCELGDISACAVLKTFNESGYGNNLWLDDWYIPSCGQLGLIFLNYKDIYEILIKIGGKELSGFYYTTTEFNTGKVWVGAVAGKEIYTSGTGSPLKRVRFVRNITDDYSFITFTINNKRYQAEEGMTWEQWCKSEYNIENYKIVNSSQTKIVDKNYEYEIEDVIKTDVIEPKSYELVTINGTDLGLISFTISGKTYHAEEGMTWAEFCDSDMNLVNSFGEKYFSCSTTNVSFCTDAGMSFKINFNDSFVIPTDLIVADANYTYYTGGGGDNSGSGIPEPPPGW